MEIKLKFLLFFCLFVSLQNSISSDFISKAFDEAMIDFDSGKTSPAIKKWTDLAESGHSDSAFYLGSIYYFGDGLPVNFPLALKLFRKAAEKNHAASQFMLGLMYAEGHGVDKNLEITVDWFDKAVRK